MNPKKPAAGEVWRFQFLANCALLRQAGASRLIVCFDQKWGLPGLVLKSEIALVALTNDRPLVP